MEIVNLPLEGISAKCDTQSRVALNEVAVAEYAEVIRLGGDLPPVVVFDDGSDIWLADGFHRFHAHRAAGAMEITCDVRTGTKRDAILYSVGANAAHGLRRTKEDKHRAVMTLLEDDEWSKWSSNEIAQRCGVSHTYVNGIRSSLETVSSERTYTTKHGAASKMETANIGKRAKDEPLPAEDREPSAQKKDEGCSPTTSPQNSRVFAESGPSAPSDHQSPDSTNWVTETLSKTASAPAGIPEGMENYDLAGEMPTMEELLKEERRENDELRARIDALTKEDTAAELDKQIRVRQGVEVRLGQEMDTNKKLDDELRYFGKLMAELRGLLKVKTNSRIVGAVRALIEKVT